MSIYKIRAILRDNSASCTESEVLHRLVKFEDMVENLTTKLTRIETSIEELVQIYKNLSQEQSEVKKIQVHFIYRQFYNRLNLLPGYETISTNASFLVLQTILNHLMMY